MLNLKRKTPAIAGFPTAPESWPTEDLTPLPPKPTQAISFGADFNLIRMVEEYGPKRLAEISKERGELERRLDVLGEEARQITKLVEALKS
jgi:hypothetical protein